VSWGLVRPDSPPCASYTLSLHDALPICDGVGAGGGGGAARLHHREAGGFRAGDPGWAGDGGGGGHRHARGGGDDGRRRDRRGRGDRKRTRLNSSHVSISYAVFCLKKNME